MNRAENFQGLEISYEKITAGLLSEAPQTLKHWVL